MSEGRTTTDHEHAAAPNREPIPGRAPDRDDDEAPETPPTEPPPTPVEEPPPAPGEDAPYVVTI